MSKYRKIATRDENSASETALSKTVTLPVYEVGQLRTDHYATHLNGMLETWKDMDAETFAKANGTARSLAKFWDSVRGLERLAIEREKLALKAGTVQQKIA